MRKSMVIIVAFYVYNQCILLLSFCRQLFFYDTFCVIKSSGESFFHPFQLYAQFHLLAACKKQQHDEADLIGTDPAASDIFIICKGKVVPFVQKLMHYYLIHVLNWVRTDRVWKLFFQNVISHTCCYCVCLWNKLAELERKISHLLI